MKPIKNLLVLTDIIFDPIKKEINKFIKYSSLDLEYYEDLIVALKTVDLKEKQNKEIIFIHSDQFFHRKPIDWQLSLLITIQNFCLENPNLRIIISNCFNNSFQLKELKQSMGSHFDNYQTYQRELIKIQNIDNSYFFDFSGLINKIGEENSYDYDLGFLYQMPYKKKLIIFFAEELLSFINQLTIEEKKVVVIDCDNTLWNGVVGEDGIDGIYCDKNAKGILFYNFQIFLKNLKSDGFLLCLCSKNNEEDVREVFRKKNMPLIWEDFIIKKINWIQKSENIKDIANQLNVGEDSLIFIDDNPFEINSVKEFTEVGKSILFTKSYKDFLNITKDYIFRKKQILNSDKNKTKLYELEASRKGLERSFQNIDDFINSLNIKLDIRFNDESDFERISQMTEKTNQFNFNKNVFSKNDLLKWMNNKDYIYSLKVTDKFGDYGTVGLMLVKLKNKNAIIENFLMSCRAIGKKTENTFFQYVLNDLEKQNIKLETILFKETNKNIPAKQFINNNNYDNYLRKT